MGGCMMEGIEFRKFGITPLTATQEAEGAAAMAKAMEGALALLPEAFPTEPPEHRGACSHGVGEIIHGGLNCTKCGYFIREYFWVCHHRDDPDMLGRAVAACYSDELEEEAKE